MQLSWRITCVLQSSPNDVDIWVWCFAPTWQCSAPYCPFNCCNNPRSVLRVSSTSTVLARPRPQWLSCFWTLKQAMGGKSFRSYEEVQQAVHEWLCSQPKEFFARGIRALPKWWNTCTERNRDYTKKLSHCLPFAFNKLRDKKYLRFSFDLPSYKGKRWSFNSG